MLEQPRYREDEVGESARDQRTEASLIPLNPQSSGLRDARRRRQQRAAAGQAGPALYGTDAEISYQSPAEWKQTQVERMPPDQRMYYDQMTARDPRNPDALGYALSSRQLTAKDKAGVVAAQQKVAAMKPKVIDDGKNPNLVQILVTFDGTWNHRGEMVDDTNPALIDEMFEGRAETAHEEGPPRGSEDRKLYVNGVGTDKQAHEASAWTQYHEGITGDNIQERIDRAFSGLVAQVNAAKRTNPNAEIVLVVTGFSRGSAAARSFVNQLNKRGVPDTSQPDRRTPGPRRAGPLDPQQHHDVRIGAMILFDTVDTTWYKNLDTSIPKNAENVLHVTAGDEERWNFALNSVRDPSQPDDPRLDGRQGGEVTLPGAHSDIGGSYPNAYSKISLKLANDYMRKMGAHVRPMTEDVDLEDPSLRLHDTGEAPIGEGRRLFTSHNPK